MDNRAMRQTVERSWGIARVFTLAFGLVFVAVAIVEVVTQDTLTPVLEYSVALNAIHWAIGVLLLIACLAGERVSAAVAGIAGVLLGAATVWLLLHRTAFEGLLDYQYPAEHPLPGSYIVLYGVTALAGLAAWISSWWLRQRTRRRSDRTPAVSQAPAAS
jgi:peptidoglycan/LPS O-acetylase OafA/YrhL